MHNEEVCPEWRPTESVSFWINRASRLLVRQQDERLRPLGLGMSQMPVLHALEDGAALSQKELALRARVEQPTMAEMLSRMERDGVVERSPNPEDRRGTLISLSRRAKSRWPKGKAELMSLEGEATASFSRADKAQLLTLLQRFADALERPSPELSSPATSLRRGAPGAKASHAPQAQKAQKAPPVPQAQQPSTAAPDSANREPSRRTRAPASRSRR